MVKWEHSSQLNFSPTWREWFGFKSKDKGRRSEANTGEAGTFRGRAGLFQVSGVPPPFYVVLVLHVRSWPLFGVSLNIMIKLAASSDLK